MRIRQPLPLQQQQQQKLLRIRTRFPNLVVFFGILFGYAIGNWHCKSAQLSETTTSTGSSSTDAVVDTAVIGNKQLKRNEVHSNSLAIEIPAGISPRIWPSWPSQQPFPCFPVTSQTFDSTKAVDKGFVFIKPVKVGGSTAAGVHLRIARNVARREKDAYMCLSRFQHGKASSVITAVPTLDSAMFLWSIVRHPTSRTISEFFHFHVSRKKVEPTDEYFQDQILNNPKVYSEYYFRTLSLNETRRLHSTPEVAINKIQSILDSYNFIAVTERMEESIVVLQLLLGLKTEDVLYLSSKNHGGFDGGGFKHGCTYIVPSFVSPVMQRFFSDTQWQEHSRWDSVLYQAVNVSLDRTINESLGRKRFSEALQRFQWAKRLVSERCAERAVYPCSAGGVPQNQTDCLWLDCGCGTTCIDEVVKEYQFH